MVISLLELISASMADNRVKPMSTNCRCWQRISMNIREDIIEGDVKIKRKDRERGNDEQKI